ncbi:MAG: hypothetical protein AB2A00_14720 [Myxococcota bacterium]
MGVVIRMRFRRATWGLVLGLLACEAAPAPWATPAEATPTVAAEAPLVEQTSVLDHGRLVKQARGLLDDQPSGCARKVRRKGRAARKKGRARPCVENPVVAVVDPRSEHIELVRAGKDISVGKQVVIQQAVANGVNTEYAPVYPSGAAVLAVKRTVPVKDRGWREVIYTPYSPTLNTPEIRARGLEYLQGVVARAQQKLRARKVPSQAFRGRLAADVVPAELAVALAINEHLDPHRFTRGETVRDLMDEVLVVLGTNERSAYNYAVSADGARGLWQFMAGTYHSLRRQYPGARLRQDFELGADDHVNAAMACLLLFDADLAVLPTRERARLRQDPEEMGRFLAATYNGGAGLVEAAYDGVNPLWTTALEAEETRTYVDKYAAIRRLLVERGPQMQSAVTSVGQPSKG